MRRRWEFRRYDRRRELRAAFAGRGWLHYAGLGPVLIVVGFHRGWRYRRRRRRPGWQARRPYAWIELTLYLRHHMFDIYPGIRIPESWL